MVHDHARIREVYSIPYVWRTRGPSTDIITVVLRMISSKSKTSTLSVKDAIETEKIYPQL